MSACDFSNKEMLSMLRNKMEDHAPDDATVKHFTDKLRNNITTIQFKTPLTKADLQKIGEDLRQKESDWNKIARNFGTNNSGFKNFIQFTYDPVKKLGTFKYNFIEYLTAVINNFNRTNREARQEQYKMGKLPNLNKQIERYKANMKKTEKVIKDNKPDEFYKENDELLTEAEDIIKNGGRKNDITFNPPQKKQHTLNVSERQLQDVDRVPEFPVTKEDIDNHPRPDPDKELHGTFADTRILFDENTPIETYHTLLKARTQYSRLVKRFLHELSREVERLQHLVDGGTTEEIGAKLIHAKEIHDRYKALWFNGKSIDKMHANEFMDMILTEMKILENNILDGNNVAMVFNRINFLDMLLNGESIDGGTIEFNLRNVNDAAMYAVRKEFADLKNNFTHLANKTIVDRLMESDVFRKNMTAMGIKDVGDIAKSIIAEGDMTQVERILKGISFSDADVGLMPETMKLIFHEIQVKHLAEAEEMKQKLKEASKKADQDKSFAYEVDENGNRTGNIIQPFYSTWSNILKRAKHQIDKLKIYKEYAEEIEYNKLSWIKEKYGSIFPYNFPHSDKAMQQYEAYLINKIGQRAYDKIKANIDKKLEEVSRLSLIEKDISKFNPFLEFKGGTDTYYREWIPKDKKYINKDYNNLNDNNHNYVETLIDINKRYISPNVEEHGEISHGKFVLGMLESLKNQKKLTGKGKKVLRHLKKLFFINRDAIIGNQVHDAYVDDFKVFKDNVYKHLRNMERHEVLAYVRESGIDITIKSNTTIAEIADLFANALYSTELETDLDWATEQMIDIASNSATRNEMLPVAQNMYRYFKAHNYNKDGVEKTMKAFIDQVIKRLRPEDIPIFKKAIAGGEIKMDQIKTLKDISKIILKNRELDENDKVILDLIRKGAETDTSMVHIHFTDKDGNIYHNYPKKGEYYRNGINITQEEFDGFYAQKLAEELNNTGIPMTIGSVFRAVNTLILHKYLGLTPILGIINRWQGMNDNGLADVTGHYWTSGNLSKSQRFLNLSNLINYGESTLTPKKSLMLINNIVPEKKIEEMKKLQKLTRVLGMKIFSEDGRTTLSDIIMSWSIKAPEFKNQMEIFLSLMQDMKIKDVDGNDHQLFDGEQLTAYELVDGKLQLKDKFRTDDNILMYEKFVKGSSGENPMAEFVAKHYKALSHIQNNFDNNDVTTTANNLLLSTFAMLKKWIVSGWQQRMDSGKGRDVTFNKKKKEGRYRTGMRRVGAGISFVAGNMGLAMGFGAGVGTLGIMGAGVGLFYLGYKMYMKKKFHQDIKTNAVNTQEILTFWKTAMLAAVDFPARIIAGRSFGFKYEPVGKGDLTPEEIGNIKALGMELGNKMALMAMSLSVLAMLYDDDDDESTRKRKLYNYLANRLSGLIYDNAIYMNPSEMINSISRVGIIDFSKNLFDLTTTIFHSDEVTDDRWYRMLTKVSLLPNTLNNVLFHGGNPFSSDQDMSSDLVKALVHGGNWAADKKIRVLNTNFNSKVKRYGITEDKQIRRLKKMWLPKKWKGEESEHYFNRLYRAYVNLDWQKVIDSR